MSKEMNYINNLATDLDRIIKILQSMSERIKVLEEDSGKCGN